MTLDLAALKEKNDITWLRQDEVASLIALCEQQAAELARLTKPGEGAREVATQFMRRWYGKFAFIIVGERIDDESSHMEYAYRNFASPEAVAKLLETAIEKLRSGMQ